MAIRNYLVVTCLLCAACTQQATWPDITSETKPWTRWWWHGSALTKEGITTELEAYAKAGLGGVEITPIYGVKGFEDKFVPYLSDEWMDLLIHTLKEAERLNIGVDMATGTGWPFGGPWITDEFASRNIYHKVYELNGGQQLKEKIGFIQTPLLRTVNPVDVKITDIKQPVESNENLQQLAIDQVQFERTLPLVSAMAYSDQGEIVDVRAYVKPDGTLNWFPEKGRWKIYALFQGWHGKMVERAGPGGEGNVIDHFSKDAIDHYLSRFDSALRNHDITSLRAFFNDSYEVDDARGAADWTPGLLDAFRNNRGYDLREHLPDLFDSTSTDSERILYDYRLTISELLLNNFTKPWDSWADKHGASTRNQAHGSPANILDLYSTVDIPEIEGTDPLRIRMATSAANVSGKPLVSSESATWLDEHFESSLGDIKSAVDLFLLNGVNHIFYHGTSYSPPGEPWPGWLFYAAVHLNPRNPQWADFDILNNYVARCQSLLQNSTADNDILLYYPVADPMSKFGPEMIEHFDGAGRQFAGSMFENVATMLLEKGYTFDFISDKQIQGLEPSNKKLIVVPSCKYIPLETMERLNNHPNVIVFGEKPKFYAGLENKNKPVAINEQIRVTQDLDDLKVARETMTDVGLEFTRRKMKDGKSVYMLRATVPFDGMISLARPGSYLIFDPMSGVIGAPLRANDAIRVQLAQDQAILLAESEDHATSFEYIDMNGEAIPLTAQWTIAFESGGPALPSSVTIDTLGSWTTYGRDYADFSGTAVYTTRFSLPAGGRGGLILDLGEVSESARVILNGQEISRLISPPFRVKIEPSMAQTENVLEVRVSNLAANRVASLDRNGISWKKFYNINFPARKPENRKDGLFDASNWVPRPSGLLGPVQLLYSSKGVER